MKRIADFIALVLLNALEKHKGTREFEPLLIACMWYGFWVEDRLGIELL